MRGADTGPFRDALAAEDFGRALELWDKYFAALQGELLARRLTETELREARELLEWARNAVGAMRAHGQQQLDLLRVVREYDEYAPPRTARLVETNL